MSYFVYNFPFRSLPTQEYAAAQLTFQCADLSVAARWAMNLPYRPVYAQKFPLWKYKHLPSRWTHNERFFDILTILLMGKLVTIIRVERFSFTKYRKYWPCHCKKCRNCNFSKKLMLQQVHGRVSSYVQLLWQYCTNIHAFCLGTNQEQWSDPCC